MPNNNEQAPSLFEAMLADTLWVAIKDDHQLADSVRFRYTIDLFSLNETLTIFGLDPEISDGTEFNITDGKIMYDNSVRGASLSLPLSLSADHSGALLLSCGSFSCILTPAKK